MNLNKEQINYKCELDLFVYENGELVNTIKKENLLTNQGRLIILSAICNSYTPYGYIDKMVFGNDDTAPTVNDELISFGDYLIRSTTGYEVDLVNENAVKVYWELDELEYNNKIVKCVGLTTGSYLFNKIVLDVEDQINKTATSKLAGVWTIEI